VGKEYVHVREKKTGRGKEEKQTKKGFVCECVFFFLSFPLPPTVTAGKTNTITPT
jgi:hypothetical protein